MPDEAITIFKVNTAELLGAFGQVDKLYTQLEGRVENVEQKQKQWSTRVVDDMHKWAASLVNVKSVMSSVVSLLVKAGDANRALLSESSETVQRRDLAFEPFLRHANLHRTDPQASAFKGRFSGIAEQYGGSFEQVATLASELVSQGFSVDEMRNPTGALEQAVQVMVAGGEWQKGSMGTGESRAMARFLTGMNLPKTGANVRRFGRAFYALRETSLKLEGLQRFAEDAPAISQVTGDDLESTMAMFSVLADTMADAQGSTGYRQVVNTLSGAGADKQKRAALDSLGLTARQVDFIGEKIAGGPGVENSAMYTVIRMFANAKTRLEKTEGGAEKFNIALNEIFGTRTSTAARVFLADAMKKFPERLADTQSPTADRDFSGAVKTGVEGPGAMIRRAREVEARVMDDPVAARIMATSTFAYAAARNRGVPEVISRNFQEKFVENLTSMVGTNSMKEALDTAAGGGQPWDKFFGSIFSIEEQLKKAGHKLFYSDQLKEAAREALRNGQGGLTFTPMSAGKTTLSRATSQREGLARLVLQNLTPDYVQAGTYGDPVDIDKTAANLVKIADDVPSVLGGALPDRFKGVDGKLNLERLQGLHPESMGVGWFQAAFDVAHARQMGDKKKEENATYYLNRLIGLHEKERDQQLAKLQGDRTTTRGELDKAVKRLEGRFRPEDYELDKDYKRLKEESDAIDTEIKRWRGSGISRERKSIDDTGRREDRLAAVTDDLLRPRRIRIDFGGAVTPARKTVEGTALG